MSDPVPMVEVWRGQFLECTHLGHAVACNVSGDIVRAWGDPDAVILPRSSCKMVQALPLVESGAAQAFGLTSEHLALACASHDGGVMHVDRVERWLTTLGLSDDALRCGRQTPHDPSERTRLVKTDSHPSQAHNNCSGKHSGFLTLNRHLKGDADYIAPSHPVQRAVRLAFEETTQQETPGFGIDGCSAPNFACTLRGLAQAMAAFATAVKDMSAGTRAQAMRKLFEAMVEHPELVAGANRACTRLMRAMEGRVAVKTGAQGVFVAIVPEHRLGVALKIVDGATRASECVIATILAQLGVLDERHPVARSYLAAPTVNWRGISTGLVTASPLLRQAEGSA
ncbi:MAG: asparaginase [Pseudomonadota bacterium]